MTQPTAGPRPIGGPQLGGPDASAMPACPFVGRAEDPALVDTVPAREHRCSKPPSPHRIRTDIQARFCLSARYQRCPVYRGVLAAPPGPSLGERIFTGDLLSLLGSRQGLAFIFFAMLIPAVIGVAFAVIDDGGNDVASPDQPVTLSDLPADTADPAGDPTLPAGSGQDEQAADQAAPAAVEEEPAAEPQAQAEPEPAEPEPDPDLSPREQLLAWTNLTEHAVQPGDCLGAIAAEYDTTIEAIAVYNGIADINNIVVGQQLTIPVGFTTPLPIQQTSSGGEQISPPDTTDDGAEEEPGADDGAGTDDGDGAGTDDGAGAAPVTTPPTPTDALLAWTDVIEWQVGPGDTLFLISLDFATTVNAIAALNGIVPTAPLQVGQLLRVPQGFLDPIE